MKAALWGAAAVLIVAVGMTGRAEEKATGPAACFEKLKTLKGEWLSKDEKTGKSSVLLRYRLTGGGTVLEETIFPGEPFEMTTMYHLDGERLVLTHYCASGNQPHMEATKESTPEKMVFECTSVSNLKSPDADHMAHAEITIKDANHFSAVWTSKAGDKVGHVGRFNVTRKTGA